MRPTSHPLILVVDDEEPTRNMLCLALRQGGFLSESVATSRDAVKFVQEGQPAAVVMDWMLANGDEGVRGVAQIRLFSQVPIMMLSARNEPADKVQALETGADDYLEKPFSMDEFIARVRALLRRSTNGSSQRRPRTLEFHNHLLHINLEAQQVERAGRTIKLSPTEFRLLLYLAERAGSVVPREDIARDLFPGGQEGSDSAIHTQVSRLRTKIGDGDNGSGPVIETVFRVGYKFVKG